MRLVSIASGSSGNCIYVDSDNTHILVDMGASNKHTEQGLNEIGVKGGRPGGTVVAHEHSDYTGGFGMLARKHDVPIYSTGEMLEGIWKMKYLGRYPKKPLRSIHPDVDFMIGDIEVKPFRTDHDVVNPVAHRIRCGRESVVVAMGMGHLDQHIVDHLQGLNAILSEFNHNVNTLETDPYPYYLKRRISGDYGHLSNKNAGRLLNYVLHDNLENILPGHLNKENNYEELAYEATKLEIKQGDHGYHSAGPSIAVTKWNSVSRVITI